MRTLNTLVTTLLSTLLLLATGLARAEMQTYYVHTDHLGTPQVLTDENQSVVWESTATPFGDQETPSELQSLRFPGQYADPETGYAYNYFRDYDPSLGRYVQSDPIGLADGPNTYAYVYGNPLGYTDPLGLNGQFTRTKGRQPHFDNRGRTGVFGCLGACASYTEGDATAQASLSPTFGGGVMVCSPKPNQKNEEPGKDDTAACAVKPEKKNCGIYDPNCDNSITGGASETKGGMGLGINFNEDGSFCVLVGPFISWPTFSPSINLGSVNE